MESLVASGYRAYVAHDHDARATGVALTDRGNDLLSTVEAIYGDIEAEWAAGCWHPVG